ncbi:MAG: hypothetical protein WBE45_05615 [Terriglobales bacterium]
MSKAAYLAIFFFLSISLLFSEDTKFDGVKIRRHERADKRELVDKIGVLSFEDVGQKLTFRSDAGDHFAIPYSDITKVVFDTDTHGTSYMASVHVHDRWLYLEYRQGDHSEKVLLVVPRALYDKATAKSQSLFGGRVTIANYPEKEESIAARDGGTDKSRTPDWKAKYSVKLDRTAHPLPELKSDKATIIVVCQPPAAIDTGYGTEVKLLANGKVIAVNDMGTYSIAYVDPGKYSLISQAQNANGFEMDLEAGKTYYFIQEIVIGAAFVRTRILTMLSRNSPEVVMYLVDGAYLSDWNRKN